MNAPTLSRYLPTLVISFTLLSLITAAQAQSLPKVVLSPVTLEPIYQETSLVGTVTSLTDALLSPSTAGLVTQVAINPGDIVAKGDTLFSLDDGLIRHEIARATAAAEGAQATLTEAERRLREAESVGAGRNIAATEVSARRSEVNIARASLSQLTAEQLRLAALLHRHEIQAPFNGVVSERSTNLGEWVAPGDSVARLVSLEHLRADFQVPEGLYPSFQGELAISFQTPHRNYSASIDTIVPVSTTGSRTFLLRSHLPEDLNLYPGNAVDAVVRASQGGQGLTVPRDALSRYPDGRVTVWVAESTNSEYRVNEKRVQLGNSFEDRIEILDGLNGSELVVIRGNESLVEGGRVDLAQAEGI